MRVKARGRTYDSPEEAFTDAAQMEELRDAEVDELRARGADAEADRRFDTWSREISAVRAAARKGWEREAGQETQPADRPRRTRRELAKQALGRRRSPRRRRASTGATGRVLRETGATGAASGVTKTLLQVLGLMVGLALVIVLVERERPQGGTFSDLAGAFARAMEAFMAPVDPLTGIDVRTSQPFTGEPTPAPQAAPRRRAPTRLTG